MKQTVIYDKGIRVFVDVNENYKTFTNTFQYTIIMDNNNMEEFNLFYDYICKNFTKISDYPLKAISATINTDEMGEICLILDILTLTTSHNSIEFYIRKIIEIYEKDRMLGRIKKLVEYRSKEELKDLKEQLGELKWNN